MDIDSKIDSIVENIQTLSERLSKLEKEIFYRGPLRTKDCIIYNNSDNINGKFYSYHHSINETLPNLLPVLSVQVAEITPKVP